MKRIFLLLVIVIATFQISQAAPAYALRVVFKDKNGTLTFADSLQFLSPKSLARRAFQGIALDSSDLPVVKAYIDTVMTTSSAVKLHNVSKWFNQIVVITYDSSKAAMVAALPMVASVKCVGVYSSGVFQKKENDTKFPEINYTAQKTRGTSAHYGLSFQQIDILQADCLHDLGYQGQGMDIGVFDVNFRYTNVCDAFDSLIMQNRVKDQYSFVKDTAFVMSQAINTDHGMNSLGCMAANKPGTYVGSAPNANYFLYNTEDINGERPIEEDNWLSAAERADSLGIYIVNSSLGYNVYDAPLAADSYTYQNLDGKTTMIAKAANKLSTKGVIVVQAQGNAGCEAWHYMLTPADADSTYSVGSVDGSGVWACSGHGPNFAGVIKPDGVAVGKAVMLVGGNCEIGSSNGSSFASPTMCGAIACLWQALPTKTAYQIKQLVKMSSDRYTAPTNTEGYGIPNFCTALSIATDVSDIKQMDYTFAVYPNPTLDGSFKVKSYVPSVKNFTYALYDMQGKCIFKSDKIYTDSFHSDALSHVAKGEYILMISTAEKVYSTKIMR